MVRGGGNHGEDSIDVRTFELLTPEVTDAGLVKPYLARREKGLGQKRKEKSFSHSIIKANSRLHLPVPNKPSRFRGR